MGAEILVSHPEVLLLAREAARDVPETALIVPWLPSPLIHYYRAVVMDGDVHEHVVVMGASVLNRDQCADIASLLSRRKATRVAYAEELAPALYQLEGLGDAVGTRDVGLLAAVAYAHAGFDGPALEIAAERRRLRVSALLDKRFWRCRFEP